MPPTQWNRFWYVSNCADLAANDPAPMSGPKSCPRRVEGSHAGGVRLLALTNHRVPAKLLHVVRVVRDSRRHVLWGQEEDNRRASELF